MSFLKNQSRIGNRIIKNSSVVSSFLLLQSYLSFDWMGQEYFPYYYSITHFGSQSNSLVRDFYKAIIKNLRCSARI